MEIYRIRIDRIEFNLERIQVEAWRVAVESQDAAFTIGQQLWTAWMHQHPGAVSSLAINQPSHRELGIS
jgi:hypothetical protein